MTIQSWNLFTSFEQYFYVPVIYCVSIDPSISMCLLIYSDVTSQYFPKGSIEKFYHVGPGSRCHHIKYELSMLGVCSVAVYQ